MSHLPSAELVAVAWLKTVAGVPETAVATTLPGDSASWSASGFVQVRTVAGNPNPDVPLRTPVVQADAWANNADSQKTPWGKASAIAEAIVAGAYAFLAPRLLVMPVGFHDARLLSVWPVTEPRRMLGDEAGFARVSVDFAMSWVVLP